MWALSLTSGIPNELFWDLSLPEIEAVIDCRVEDARAATLRAGLIAATILNVNRRKGASLVQATDFVREKDEFLDPEQAAEFMDRWAQSQGGVIVEPTVEEVLKFSKE